MNNTRITISIPKYLHSRLVSTVPSGQISQYISDAVETKLAKTNITSDPIKDFFSLADTLPHMTNEQIKAAINRDRI
jgi:hypothetical protein